MSKGQKTLTSYFTKTATTASLPVAVKRPYSPESCSPPRLNGLVLTKSEENGKTLDAAAAENGQETCLTPEAKKRMFENRMLARIKLQAKKTCALHSSIGQTWFEALEPEFKKPYFEKLSTFLAEERKKYNIYPPEHQVWSWTQYFPMQNVKVVILGQDPYHGPGQAHGLCFSVQKGVPAPPSLVNIYKELKDDIPGFEIPNHGNLSGWAKQGVLLLNACLTVRAGCANSHKDQGWENVTDAVITWISENTKGVVFLLWGAYAQKKAAVVDKKKHHLLFSPHPSPLSAHRGFLGCKHFSKCNELLVKQGKAIIEWGDLILE